MHAAGGAPALLHTSRKDHGPRCRRADATPRGGSRPLCTRHQPAGRARARVRLPHLPPRRRVAALAPWRRTKCSLPQHVTLCTSVERTALAPPQPRCEPREPRLACWACNQRAAPETSPRGREQGSAACGAPLRQPVRCAGTHPTDLAPHDTSALAAPLSTTLNASREITRLPGAWRDPRGAHWCRHSGDIVEPPALVQDPAMRGAAHCPGAGAPAVWRRAGARAPPHAASLLSGCDITATTCTCPPGRPGAAPVCSLLRSGHHACRTAATSAAARALAAPAPRLHRSGSGSGGGSSSGSASRRSMRRCAGGVHQVGARSARSLPSACGSIWRGAWLEAAACTQQIDIRADMVSPRSHVGCSRWTLRSARGVRSWSRACARCLQS